jgi:small nuclear ribonucleoprotein (snRNP)-like protein
VKKEKFDRQRKDDTRRKILLGAWVLNKLKNDESFKGQLTDFEKFLSTESKTEENSRKIKIFLMDLFGIRLMLFPSRNVLPNNQIEMSYMDISKSSTGFRFRCSIAVFCACLRGIF